MSNLSCQFVFLAETKVKITTTSLITTSLTSAPASCHLVVVVQSPPIWGWVEMAGQFSRGARPRSPPLSWTVFSLGRPLTGHNWATPLLLLDRTPFGVSLSWHYSLLVAMSILTQAPSATILTPGTPAPSATLMWAEILFSALLPSSECTSFAPPLLVLTFAQSVQLALQWVGVTRRATPKAKLAPPLRPIPSLQRLCPLHPLAQGSLHYRSAFINHVLLGASHVTPAPCALLR